MAIAQAYECQECGNFQLYENLAPETCQKCGDEFCPYCIEDGLCPKCLAEIKNAHQHGNADEHMEK